MRLIDAAGFERRLMFTVDRDEICDDCLRSFLDEMAQEKTIDPVKRGRWEHVEGYNNYYDDLYRCSLCGDEFVLDGGTPKDNDYNYCPNCGAKMISEEE